MKRYFIYFGVGVFALSLGFSPLLLAQSAPPGTARFDPRHPPTTTLALPFETLFDIAERTRSPIYGIIEANGFRPPYQISAGQVIKLPPLKVHVVQRGETFVAISRRYSVQTRSLAVFNNMRPPYTVKLGQKIILPAMVQDNLTGLEPQDLVDLLAVEIDAGKTVSGSSANIIVRRPEAAANVPRMPSLPEVRPPATIIPPIIPSPPPPPPPPNKMANIPPPIQTPSVSVVSGRFSWPLQGSLLETFGEKEGFRKIDGIEIGASENTPFRASADGEVAYVGDRLPGYGWLALLRHEGGFITAYAYASEIVVKEGDKVKKGQVIGKVGATGRALSPRLLFQIRAGVTPIDPIRHLPRG